MNSSGFAHRHRLWLRLYFAPGVGGATLAKLMRGFPSVESLFEAGEEAFTNLEVPAGTRAAIHRSDLDAHIDQLEQEMLRWPDGRILTPACDDYPTRLLGARTVPAALFVRGRLDHRLPAVAVVGSRQAQTDRAHMTRDWCRQWAEDGASIVSGLAEGIDGAAHQGALAAGGHTVAVLGTGLARTYPWHHGALLDRILASGGAVVSQFTPHARVRRGFFPARNATIAGLADVVVVMQAGSRSGALSTADHARRSARHLLVLPSHPADVANAGCLRLLRNTACALSSPDDVARLLHLKSRQRARAEDPPLPAEEQELLDHVGFGGTALDELVRALELPAATVLDRLLRLELAGAVARQPGPRYVRTR